MFLSLLCHFFLSFCFLSQCFGLGINSALNSIAALAVGVVDTELYAQHFFACFMYVFFTFSPSSSGDVKGLLGTSPRCDHLSRLDN